MQNLNWIFQIAVEAIQEFMFGMQHLRRIKKVNEDNIKGDVPLGLLRTGTKICFSLCFSIEHAKKEPSHVKKASKNLAVKTLERQFCLQNFMSGSVIVLEESFALDVFLF